MGTSGQVNLKQLLKCVKPFPLEMVSSVTERITKGDQPVSLALKVAYQYVPILLYFSFQGKCYFFRVLPLPLMYLSS